jgi:hypothetical protein
MIGQDSHGNWVVRGQSGLRGGLFVGRAEALRYVRSEAGDHPGIIVMVSGPLELGSNGMRKQPISSPFEIEERRTRRIA